MNVITHSIQLLWLKFYSLGTRASNNALADILIEANTTGRFWIGASDLEEVGHFKWFYSGKTIPQIHWDNKGKPKDEDEAIKLDMVCAKSFYIGIHKF